MQKIFRDALGKDAQSNLFVLLILAKVCRLRESFMPSILCTFCICTAEAAADAWHGSRFVSANSLTAQYIPWHRKIGTTLAM
jgi:hypothetical protein